MRDANEICEEIAFLARTHLDLSRWGFKESVRLTELSAKKNPAVIYDSPQCRISLSFVEWEPAHQSIEYTIRLYYGRLHAPDDQTITIWNHEECYCWHLAREVLHFLDARTPEYTAKNLYSHDLLKKYRETVSSKTLRYKLPEWEIRKHATIWANYAPRLFEVFDLRRPELWEEYRQFVKQVYDIKGRNPAINPPPDKIC